MREPICPADEPEKYAHNYLRPEQDVELFEKAKALHDHCQQLNIPMVFVALYPSDGSGISLYHFHNNANEMEEANKNYLDLMAKVHGMIHSSSGGQLSIMRQFAFLPPKNQ